MSLRQRQRLLGPFISDKPVRIKLLLGMILNH